MVRPWPTRPAASSLRPSAPFSTLTFAPASPVAASLTICGSWSMSIRSSATRSYEAAASAWMRIRSASALARMRTFSASASAGLTTSATSWRSRSSACRRASSAWALMTSICACASVSGPICAAFAWAWSTSALYCACTTAVCRAYSACLRCASCSASAAAWLACACAILACRWMAARCGAAIASMYPEFMSSIDWICSESTVRPILAISALEPSRTSTASFCRSVTISSTVIEPTIERRCPAKIRPVRVPIWSWSDRNRWPALTMLSSSLPTLNAITARMFTEMPCLVTQTSATSASCMDSVR